MHLNSVKAGRALSHNGIGSFKTMSSFFIYYVNLKDQDENSEKKKL